MHKERLLELADFMESHKHMAIATVRHLAETGKVVWTFDK